MTQLLPPKKEVALALLERSNVDIYLDPRSQGVVVPPQFRKEPRLILKIGLNMPVPIPDLRLDDESMSCTLSFNRAKFFCVVPWPSVFAMVGDDGRGMVWPDDVPQELAARVEDRPRPVGDPAPPSSRGGRTKPLLVEDPVGAPGGPTKKKGGKKKKDEASPPARPMLHAVPSPPPSGARLDKSDKSDKPSKTDPKPESKPDIAAAPISLREAKGEGVDAKPEEKAAPSPAARPAAPGARPKRELPPYLRVVK